MSYTEYLRRKQAGAPVVINNQKLRTASELTQERRLLAASVFPINGQAIGTLKGDLLLTETAVNHKQPVSFQKNTGKPKNASDFTAYVGSHTLQNDTKVFVSAGKTTNPAACVLNSAAQIAEPSPYITSGPNATTGSAVFPTTTGVKATTVARSGSDYIRERTACIQAQGQKHVGSEVSEKPVFKDDTMRYPYLNKTYLSGATNCVPDQSYPPVVRTVVLDIKNKPGPVPLAKPRRVTNYDQALASQDHVPPLMGTNTLPNCFTGKNVVGVFSMGNVVPSKHPRYVEKHHGNDLATMVNGRKPVPAKYQIPRGTPAHMKINDPLGPRTPNM